MPLEYVAGTGSALVPVGSDSECAQAQRERCLCLDGASISSETLVERASQAEMSQELEESRDARVLQAREKACGRSPAHREHHIQAYPGTVGDVHPGHLSLQVWSCQRTTTTKTHNGGATMSYQPDSYQQADVTVQQASGEVAIEQNPQSPAPVLTQNQGAPGTNPYLKYTLLDGVVGFVGALVVLYTQSLGGTFFIFLCAFIAFYRGIRALLYTRSHPGAPGRMTGIVSLILGFLSIGIMIYLLAAVGVQ